MDTVGLRELRQRASDLIRRVEAGEEITISVAGRPSARLVPIEPGVPSTKWRMCSVKPKIPIGIVIGTVDQRLRDPLDGH